MQIHEAVEIIESHVPIEDRMSFWDGFLTAAKLCQQDTKIGMTNEQIALELAAIAAEALSRHN